jgi:hypothetical protein
MPVTTGPFSKNFWMMAASGLASMAWLDQLMTCADAQKVELAVRSLEVSTAPPQARGRVPASSTRVVAREVYGVYSRLRGISVQSSPG